MGDENKGSNIEGNKVALRWPKLRKMEVMIECTSKNKTPSQIELIGSF